MGERGAVVDHLVAAGWGLAEATVFFLVPDVWTSRVALRRPRRALATTASAVAGAMLGGAVLHSVVRRIPAPETARWMTALPAINTAMVARVDAEVARSGVRALLLGPTRGVPYKLYARALALAGLPVSRLVAWTVPARAVRFLLVTGACGALAAGARRWGINVPGRGPALLFGSPERAETALHTAGWLGFYAWYFSHVGRPDEDPAPRDRLSDRG